MINCSELDFDTQLGDVMHWFPRTVTGLGIREIFIVEVHGIMQNISDVEVVIERIYCAGMQFIS